MITKQQQAAIDHLAILISNYVGETDVGFENIAVLDGLYDTLRISPELKNWWTARMSKACARSNQNEKS